MTTRWIKRADVLRIISEHEREQAAVAIGVRAVKGSSGEPWRRGALAIELRKAWRGPWDVSEGPPDEPQCTYWFSEDGLLYGSSADRQTTQCDGPYWSDTYLRPSGKTWAEVEAMAELAEKQTP